MDAAYNFDISLTRDRLKGRTFLLGNKRAFSLALPASNGTSATQLHPHKWFGAQHYGRKFLEAQVVRLWAADGPVLGSREQTGFHLGLTSARREYRVEGCAVTETYFVPDGVQGIVCSLAGNIPLCVQPEFDMRFYRALNSDIDGYTVEPIDDGVLVTGTLPAGTYDDASETFLPSEDGTCGTPLYAAVRVLGDGAWMEMATPGARAHRKIFRKDAQRHRFLAHAGADAVDHAPLWSSSSSQVYAPVNLFVSGNATIVYGFGASREEALGHLTALQENLLAFEAQKSDVARGILQHGALETGHPRVDIAHAQVLTRLMDGLVARNTVAEDTVLHRPATMILAGNQYFHDSWKRDENIALGFLLTLGFYDLARDVIASTWQLQDERTGRLPQRIRAGETPPYHSSDGTLWALWRLYQYWRCSGDESLLRETLPMVRHFFACSLGSAVAGLLPSGRTAAADYLWETWMDTPHTPRDGFPVEIQMLWIACLRVFRPILRETDPELESAMEGAESAAWLALQRFTVDGMPADSLDEQLGVRDLLTPNPYFCFGLGLDLGSAMESTMRSLGRRQLAGRQGIVTLAPRDWNRVFPAEFLADRRNVRGRRMRSIGKFNYHRGVEWNWLAQFFVRAELKYGEPDAAWRTYLQPQVSAALDRGGIGGVSELFDLSGTRGPEFQAWSMSGLLEALHAFGGVTVDVPARRISIEPQIPSAWPALKVRSWYGRVPLDIHYTRTAGCLALDVRFPWGDVPDATLDISLILPPRHTANRVDVHLDGIPQSPGWYVEQIPGTDRTRIRLSVPATASVQLAATVHAVARSVRTA